MSAPSPRGTPVLFDGIKTGLLLQFSFGPVFFFLVDLSIHRGFLFGFSGVLAVTLADLVYILLAIAGLGALLSRKGVEPVLRIAGSLILASFGVIHFLGALGVHVDLSGAGGAAQGPSGAQGIDSPLAAFGATFLLTISSPMTILFWTGLFSAKIAERGYKHAQLYVFGAGALVCTLFFMTLFACLFSLVGAVIPASVAQILNAGVGVVLIVYAVLRLRPKKTKAPVQNAGASSTSS